MLFKAENLKHVVTELLLQGGSESEEGEIVAEHLVRSNLTGHDSHGVGMIPLYIKKMSEGLLKTNQKPQLVKEDGSIIMFDGQRGFGQSVAKNAMNRALERCRETGLVLMTLRNAYHIGRIGTYGEQSIAAGMVSLHFVNVTDHPPLVAPFRGSDARYATNPICIAMPGTDRQPPVLLDMATSYVALGKVRVALNKGEQLAEEWVIDEKGKPSRDPEVMKDHIYHGSGKEAPLGAMRPLGGYKGYGLALFCELLGGMLSGGKTIQPGNERLGGITNNMLTFIVDPSRLIEMPVMQREIESLVEYVKASPVADEMEPILVAGDPERISICRREREGIPLDSTTWEQILDAGESLGMEREKMIEIAGIQGEGGSKAL